MTEESQTAAAYDSPADIGKTERSKVKRWLLELNLAHKEEKEWRALAVTISDRYRTKKAKANSFNILWANTETMRQAIYNTLPKPDVRRRFRDDDPVGKVVSNVIERCASYSMDVYDFDHVLKLDVLDMLLAGRGISRVKYVPDFEAMESDQSQESEESDESPDPEERLAYESVMCEHVNWDDFRHGPGKIWSDVRWIAFRHQFSKSAGVQKFGDVFDDVPLDKLKDEETRKTDEELGGIFKTAEAWEVWNLDDREVFFIVASYKEAPLYPIDNPNGEDPLGLDGFYPIARPLYAIEDSDSLIPAPLYEQYRQQAEELDRATSRINNLIEQAKAKGVYNTLMGEMTRLETAKDGELIPAQNVIQLAESGGLEKNIWYWPIEAIANVITVLTRHRQECKDIVYEITGISDIMRGATDAQETKGAQQIKSQWGTQRLKKMQSEFQRYVRDIIRIKCQIIANKFQPETIMEMTGLKLARDDAEKDQIKQQQQAFEQFQQQQKQQQAPQGQQIPHGAPQ